jgi:predicted AlkP superfamily pyrophosphatase or phosphodiesterase
MTPLAGVLPAVTCSAQAAMLAGSLPTENGVVGNGWLFRETGEVRFWLQSNRLIEGETIYAAARRIARERGERFTCAKLFWWFNQGAPVDWSVTPKPHYGADGSKAFAIHGSPTELPAELEAALGAFPFHTFWGPLAGLAASQWIAAAAADVLRRCQPTLTLIYLPHLDYDLQRFGPDAACVPTRLAEVDACAGAVIDAARETGALVVVVSEYGLVSVRRPVMINRVLREAGWLAVRPGPFGEMLDTFGSRAFAVADHQVAHVYVADPVLVPAVAGQLGEISGVGQVLDRAAQRELGLDHARSGELVVLAERDAWFAYPYWLDDAAAPDFARTVDIHRKPGYDPCELFIDPALCCPRLRVAARLLQKKLGMRYLMDVIPLDPSLVRGSHGLAPADPIDGPILIAAGATPSLPTRMTNMKPWLLQVMGLE